MPGLGGSGQPTTAPRRREVSISYEAIAAADHQPIASDGLHEITRVDLGEGAMSTPVAIKQPATDRTLKQGLVERFRTEATTWAALETAPAPGAEAPIEARDHIVGLLDWGPEPVPWLAMEYMDGGSLAELLERGELPTDQALWVGHCIARALMHAHQQAVVHHDLTPGNVLFVQTPDRWRFPKLGDWGSAGPLDGASAGEANTVAYAAPEQLERGHGQPGPATDIYQLGTLVYRLLTGVLPFEGDAATIREAKLTSEPVPPSERAGLAEDFDAALLPALRREPGARYDTVAYLRDELEGLRELSAQSVTRSGPASTPGSEGARAAVSTASAEPDSRPASWEATSDRLEERQREGLYRRCPGPLRRVAYPGLHADVEAADERRDDARATFEQLTERARDRRSQVEQAVSDAKLLGGDIEVDPVETARALERLGAKLGDLRAEAAPALREDEQTTLDRLRAALAEHERYLRTKHRLTRTLERVTPGLEAAADRVSEQVTEGLLLELEDERALVAELDGVSRSLRTARRQLDTAVLSESERRSLDRLVDREAELRTLVTEHNPTIVQERLETLREAVLPSADRSTAAVEPARTEGEALPEAIEAVEEAVFDAQEQLREFRIGPESQYLTPAQRQELEDLADQFREDLAFVDAKRRFTAAADRLEADLAAAIDQVEPLLDRDRYLGQTSRRHCEDLVEYVRETALPWPEDHERLAAADREAYAEMVTTLDSLAERVGTHNERFLQSEVARLGEEYVDLGEEALSLNDRQCRAVATDERHNRVIAGPGTGKTVSLACRIDYLVARGVDPSRILALTYNRAAAGEIERRVERLFGINGVECSTLHSIGNRVLRRARPDYMVLAGVPREREVGGLRDRLCATDPAFREHYETFQSLWAAARLTSDHDERAAVVDSLQFDPSRTTRGESLEEVAAAERAAHVEIADALNDWDVPYVHRRLDGPVRRETGEEYVPDFTLPAAGVRIDYHPVPEQRAAKDSFERKIAPEEVSQLQAAVGGGVESIALRASDARDGGLRGVLERRLSDAGISLRLPPDPEASVERAYEWYETVGKIDRQLASFVNKAKTTEFDRSQLAQLDVDADPTLYHFSHAAAILYEAYRERYAELDAIDYTDMIIEARRLLENGTGIDAVACDHVLVDEFQDLDDQQIRLLQALLGQDAQPHLYAVGDDWQSINGFRGARPEIFSEFDRRFTPAESTQLTRNYRCPPGVVDAGAALMRDREELVSKTLEADARSGLTPVVHRVAGSNEFTYVANAVTCICNLVEASIAEAGRAPAEILVIVRNKLGSPFPGKIHSRLQDRGIETGSADGVRVSTAHKAKGTEAEHVIVANAAADRTDGFPTSERTHELTALVDHEQSVAAEERRLFYVAITRTAEQLDVQTDANAISEFVDDIDEHVRTTHQPFDIDQSRPTLDGVVSSTNTLAYWGGSQVGTIRLQGGYQFGYLLKGTTGQEFLEEGERYRLQNLQLDSYDGYPNLQIDAQTVPRRDS
jgi:DNA helicase-4